MTVTLDKPALVTPAGSPYTLGDPIVVQLAITPGLSSAQWCEATVTAVYPMAPRPRFGRQFRVGVTAHTSTSVHYAVVTVDDNGRNHTINHGVRPSSRLADYLLGP